METKNALLSKGVLGGIGTIVTGLAVMFGAMPIAVVNTATVDINGVDPNVISDVLSAAEPGGAFISGVILTVLGALSLLGRLFPLKSLKLLGKQITPILVLAVLLFAAGCEHAPRIYATPAEAQYIEMSTINSEHFNRECQAGDPNACRVGLKHASAALRMITDEIVGRPTAE